MLFAEVRRRLSEAGTVSAERLSERVDRLERQAIILRWELRKARRELAAAKAEAKK